MAEETKVNWFRQHWAVSIFLGLIVIGMIGTLFGGNSQSNPSSTGNFVNEQKNNQAQICSPNWQCSSYSECSSLGTQTRICSDSNNCNTLTGKPPESQSCVYDNRLSCPMGNKLDSGQKIDDWFNCTDVKAVLNLKLSKENIDCSNQNNFQTSKLDFSITRYCEVNGQELWGDNGANCESFWKGTLRPQVIYEAFPSFNEYRFAAVGIGLNNIGCTKENLSDYLVYYNLYQNNQLIASNYKVLGKSYFGILEPQAGNYYFNDFVSFGDSQVYANSPYTNSPIVRTTPEGYTIKICLFNKSQSLLLSCDWANFDMKYSK
ncbi:hypothetical protein HY449_01085 [Candidatus Pacearchaeota archaeon]|nr:hypothetical protein [Candidatus Pacearchaeota archaeon]